MKTLLTPILLDFLIIEGYKYCASKANGINTSDASESITLIPLKSKRVLNRLSGSVDKYFSIKSEPVQMAEGFDDTLVMVEIDSSDLKRYISFFMEKLALSKSFFKPNLQNEC
ncbi:hypothetical protein [Mucilaginibacter jinjuensis]|uniref:Uncharacterized protein n=1 Tax=Mucilaginibacter jinjuensis TaxID=1176721 RepID=A0ABY7T8V6_9SPHI|nr:hypothetical protein [Mucilaginibacter jinjuensis]WCT12550.1 hypothetical protein PQO05_01220 [Mucilaginibacter jinjuensis]